VGGSYEQSFGFAGFTSATFNGNVGGRNAAHAVCEAAFAGAHLCYASEYLSTESTAPVPAGGAWFDVTSDLNNSASLYGVSPLFGRYTSGACTNWTSNASGISGYLIGTDGGVASAPCNTVHPLACCNGTPRDVFAGVTSVNATMSGRVQMHALCKANYPGSHLCHAAEYVRADSSASIPASGAWLDLSSDINGGGALYGASPLFGRYTSGACTNWTSTASGISGYLVASDGSIASAPCNTVRPAACCL
jgi:hypothetical protein